MQLMCNWELNMYYHIRALTPRVFVVRSSEFRQMNSALGLIYDDIANVPVSIRFETRYIKEQTICKLLHLVCTAIPVRSLRCMHVDDLASFSNRTLPIEALAAKKALKSCEKVNIILLDVPH